MTPSRTLARDYKHVRRNAPGTQGFTGWTGLLIGLSIGLAVALGVFLHYRNPAPEQPTPEATAAPASAQASETAPPAPAPAGAPPEYDFYKMLPEQEVEVPKDARAPVDPVAPAGVRGDVTLQVGSFKGMDQAEKMQARLALQGIESRIQRFTLAGRDLVSRAHRADRHRRGARRGARQAGRGGSRSDGRVIPGRGDPAALIYKRTAANADVLSTNAAVLDWSLPGAVRAAVR